MNNRDSNKKKSEILQFDVPDWFDELNEEQQNDVLEGLADADRGDTVPHSEAVKLLGKSGLA